MKCLTIIAHASAKPELTDFLLNHEAITGFTIVDAEGHSQHTGRLPFETSRDLVLGYVPRLRVDILLDEETLEAVIGQLCDCESCVTGRGIWWVTPVERHGGL